MSDKRYFYVEVAETGRVIGLLDTFGKIDSPTMIEVSECDESYLKKKYNFESGVWEEVLQEPTPEPEPTAEEMLNAMLGVTSYE